MKTLLVAWAVNTIELTYTSSTLVQVDDAYDMSLDAENNFEELKEACVSYIPYSEKYKLDRGGVDLNKEMKILAITSIS